MALSLTSLPSPPVALMARSMVARASSLSSAQQRPPTARISPVAIIAHTNLLIAHLRLKETPRCSTTPETTAASEAGFAHGYHAQLFARPDSSICPWISAADRKLLG